MTKTARQQMHAWTSFLAAIKAHVDRQVDQLVIPAIREGVREIWPSATTLWLDWDGEYLAIVSVDLQSGARVIVSDAWADDRFATLSLDVTNLRPGTPGVHQERHATTGALLYRLNVNGDKVSVNRGAAEQ